MVTDVHIPPHLYPFAPHYFDRGDGLRLHYVDEGESPEGEAVVMVHGNPSWSFYYRSLITALSPSRRVIAIDHIGCGKSDKPPKGRYGYRLTDRIADLEALLKNLGLTRVTLVVHDWGGMIGMGWATRHPDLVERIVVLNTGAFHLPRAKPFPKTIALARAPLLGDFLVRGASAFSRGANWMCVTKTKMPADVAQGYLAPYDSWGNRVAVHQFVKDIPLSPTHPTYSVVSDIADDLEKLKDKPMLIAWGMKDFVFDHHFLAEWEKRFPEAQVHRFEDSGHYVLEDAGEEIAALVSDFVEVPHSQEAAS